MNKINTRKIQKLGGSYFVTLPMDIVKELGWKEKQKVIITRAQGKKIEIKDWK